MLNAEQLQWIKQRAWARCLFFMAILCAFFLVVCSVPFFIMFSWQYSHMPGQLLVLGASSLLVGFLSALWMGLMLVLMWPLIKKSTKKLNEHIRQRLSVPELEPTSCPMGVVQIYKPF